MQLPKHILRLTLLLSLGSYILDPYFYPAHLLVHFQLQYAIAIFIATISLIIQKNYKVALIGIMALLIFYVPILYPLVYVYPEPSTSPDIFFINANYANSNPQIIVDKISEINPSQIAFVESGIPLVNAMTQSGYTPALNHRYYSSSCTLYSPDAISAEIKGAEDLPICVLHLPDYDLIAIHVHRPIGKEAFLENIAFFDQLNLLIEQYEQNGQNFLIVGDFNTTTYSKYFRERFGAYPSQNTYTWLPHSPIALPIDHVITNLNVKITPTSDLGSDHRGLLIDIL